MGTSKKLLSSVVAVVLAIGLFPVAAFAQPLEAGGRSAALQTQAASNAKAKAVLNKQLRVIKNAICSK